MGHIINPVSHRIGYTRFWNINWALSSTSKNINYSYVTNESLQLLQYTKNVLFALLRPLFRKGWLLLNLQLLRFNNFLIFILLNQIKFIKNLYKVIYKGLNSMFVRKKTEFLWRWSVAKNINEKRRRVRHLFHMSDHYPYKVSISLQNKLREEIYLRKLKQLDNHFLYTSFRLPRFNTESNEPSLLTYLWTRFLPFFTLSRKLRLTRFSMSRKFFKKDMVLGLLKAIWSSRWISRIKKFLQFSFRRITGKKIPIEIIFICVDGTTLTASFIAKYLSTRLLQKFPIRRLMSNLIKQLKLSQQNAYIHGFKIICNGRFARRGRASHVWKMLGKLPISNKNIFVDYSIMLPVLVNSICAVKVWLLKPTETTKLFVI